VPPARSLLWVAAGLASAVAVLAVAVLAVDPLPGETALMRAIRGDPQGGSGGWQAVSDATDLLPVVLLCVASAVALLLTGRRGPALLLVAAPLGAAALTRLVKQLVRRERPPEMLSAEASEFCFPSGHLAHGTAAAAVVVALLLPVLGRRGRPLLVAAGLVVLALTGAAQLVLARHYPSDLIAGVLLGAAWVAVLLAAAVSRRR
jgi:membrane-associated phospholipid phosphatase